MKNDEAIAHRVSALPWAAIEADLDERGFACIGALLTKDECEALALLYDDASRFRSRVVMARHGFGRGEYQYFAYPLPPITSDLRRAVYPHLVPIANRWAERMHQERRYPETHDAFVAECHRHEQTRPTPLLLKYEAGDYNCLHQDLYGEIAFPLQLAILLSVPERDFSGGELVLTEQRPRMQSRVEVVPLGQGDAVVFAVHQRPAVGVRGSYRVNMRHGVSRVRRGRRFTMGIIFHDAK